MNIGIMLRAYDRPGGIGIYSRNIVKHLLMLDVSNNYVLIYGNKKHIGTFRSNENVSEICVPKFNALLWDQLRMLHVIKDYSLDLIFNTKFSVPLFAKIRTIMALHGSSWYTNPEFYNKFDIIYEHAMMPLYCRKADFLISNSDVTTQDYKKYLHVRDSKVATVHLAPADRFFSEINQQELDRVKNKYNLPDIFLLTVTSYEEKRKNFSTLLKAFERCRNELNVELVVAGKNCEKYIEDFELRKKGLDKFIHFLGWVEQSDLPAIYNLAKVFVFPSVYEEFGIPVLEAMACGCPVVASNTGAISEIAKDAALLCEPFDDQKFCENICRLITSKEDFENYRNKGFETAKCYSWSKAARETLDIFSRFL